jgi:hypothetical protein
MPGPCKQLFCCIKNSFVEVKKTVLNIVPQKMNVYFMSTCRLSAIIAEMTFKMLLTVLTGGCHILALADYLLRLKSGRPEFSAIISAA